MTMRAISICIFLLAQSLLACGDGDEGEAGDDGGAVIEPEQLTADLAALLCEAAGPCDCKASPEASDCVGAISPAVAGRVATGETLGLRYHAECLERTRAYADALACRSAGEVEGDVAVAQLRWDALRCKLFAGGDQLGDPCASAGNVDFMSLGDSCAQGLYCAERCYELVESAGDSCAFGTCPPGKDCLDPDADGVFTCEKPPAAGERCNPHGFDCEGALVCDPMQLVCTEPPGPGEQCPEGQCTSDSLCVDGVCELLPGDGELCGGFGCAAGLRCDYNTNTCAPPVGEGEPCLYLEDCAEGLLCNTDTYTCTPLPGEGDDCPIGLCAPDLVCGFDSICATPPPVTCDLPFCIYRFDGLCDEPGGTGLCHEGTDPEDCEAEARARGEEETRAAARWNAPNEVRTAPEPAVFSRLDQSPSGISMRSHEQVLTKWAAIASLPKATRARGRASARRDRLLPSARRERGTLVRGRRFAGDVFPAPAVSVRGAGAAAGRGRRG